VLFPTGKAGSADTAESCAGGAGADTFIGGMFGKVLLGASSDAPVLAGLASFRIGAEIVIGIPDGCCQHLMEPIRQNDRRVPGHVGPEVQP
jgi:hypothetical protein